MKDKYHKRKLDELEKENTKKLHAIVDYNIMMGTIDDPEEDEEEEEEDDTF